MGFSSRQEYWSGLPFPPPGDLPDPGTEPVAPAAPALQADSLSLEPPGKPSFPLKFPFFSFLDSLASWIDSMCKSINILLRPCLFLFYTQLFSLCSKTWVYFFFCFKHSNDFYKQCETVLGCIRHDGPLTCEWSTANWGLTGKICSLISSPHLRCWHHIPSCWVATDRAAGDTAPLLNSVFPWTQGNCKPQSHAFKHSPVCRIPAPGLWSVSQLQVL